MTAGALGEPRPARFSWAAVAPAGAALLVALAATANLYGYHRDELYFRVLPRASGYVDQPPLTPWLARTFSEVIADEPWALRIPAVIAAVATVFVVALVAREVGGGALAQGLAAWGYGFGVFPLLFGHVFLTTSLDLLVWPLVTLFILRAVLRGEGRWWLLAGLVVGLSLNNKLLIVLLLAAVAIGLAVAGPRRVFRTPWPYLALAVAVVAGAPAILYQLLNGLPQLTMGAALSAENGGEVRTLMWPFLALLIGPSLVVFWVVGLIALFRRPGWRTLRFLAVAFLVLLVLVFASGSQFYYPLGLLSVVFAIGCVPIADWARTRGRRAVAIAAVALNAVVSILISLPVVPLGMLGTTPIPAMNQAVADQVGWPRYVEQVERVAAEARATDAGTIVLASNYGEAGALDRFGSEALPPVYSGHNALADGAPPPPETRTVVVVGGQYGWVRSEFANCEVVDRFDNGVDVDNEEQGEPIAVCRDPLRPWSAVWTRLAHLS
ncbi:glycosyltransferase family 39 protein [Herbiconiux sp. CPCC 205763]|uniref:Glycosyltransferase family 39 protein n=1 Tax=Herbiconiux aconitum TaxID=2970913 RepID=A0ABT2GP73_9MICO|nr:glycosyltransferase family 39 protein [Herbiconiux aconitum]MCS5718016.1 glycosyltransferase family 39 protein [Herbiconiux aconitum]